MVNNHAYDTSAEYTVVATLMVNPSVMAGATLTADQFQSEDLARCYSVLSEMASKNQCTDYLIAIDEIKKRTGYDYTKLLAIAQKNSIIPRRPQDAEHYCQYISETARRARSMALCEAYLKNPESGTSESLDGLVRDLMSLAVEDRNYQHTLKDATRAAIDAIETAWESKGLIGVSTGLKDLDESLGGLHKSDLIIIGARPAMGKTALAINMMMAGGARCGFISSEQSAEQIGMRCLSLYSKIDLHSLRLAKYSTDQSSNLSSAVAQLSTKNIFINDKPGITDLEIMRQAREWKQKHDIQILFVDYLQKIKAEGRFANRVESVGEVTVNLKNLAKELQIPVVALAQVNRGVESREDKRPMCSDLKDSGTIEQEADVIAMLYRDEVYNEESNEKGIALLGIEKNRSGPTGDVRIGFDKKTVRFHDLSEWSHSYE